LDDAAEVAEELASSCRAEHIHGVIREARHRAAHGLGLSVEDHGILEVQLFLTKQANLDLSRR
jgi:hypothetical protein